MGSWNFTNQETQARDAYTALFRKATDFFSPGDIWIAFGQLSSTEYDFPKWKSMGLSFTPWTIFDNRTLNNSSYPLPSALVNMTNRMIVWVYGGYGISTNVAQSQFQSAKQQGAVGGVYWVALPTGQFSFDWQDAYAQVMQNVFPIQ